MRCAMSKSPEVCPKCGHRFHEGSPNPGSCPGCGELCVGAEAVVPPPLPTSRGLNDDQTPTERRRWRLCFWLCFLLTPAAVLLVVLSPNLLKNVVPGPPGQFQRLFAPFGVVGTFALGAIGSGFCLAKLHARPRTTAGLVVATIAIALGLTIVYAGIFFVGCLALMSKMKF
jgi:hypothetical protein